MKKVLLISVLISALLIAGYKVFISKGLPTDKPPSKPRAAEAISRLKDLPHRVKETVAKKKKPSPKEPAIDQPDHPIVALYFKDGSVMQGELISETDEKYIIKWKGSEVIVYADQLSRIDREGAILKTEGFISDEEITRQWPYENDIVVRLTNGVVLDAKITGVDKDRITLLYLLEEGGQIEQYIERPRVEYLIFKPIDNAKSKKAEDTLKELFPKMKFYKEGGFTIVTDSYITWVKKYRSALREQYTDLYLNFFDLFKDRKPHIQNFIVIFDEHIDFIEYAIADGVPGWMVAGYFSPVEKVLYLYNVLGESFSEFLFQALAGESGRRIDDMVERIEGRVDKRYHIFIEGQAKKIKDKYWEAYSYYKGMFRERTMSTLRHEFTHQAFYNWGLQNIILSTVKTDKEGLIRKKKEFLETKDPKKKAELARKLLTIKSEEKPPDMKAANSWLAEGTATYCEVGPMGSQNNRWLYYYQEMARKGPVYPLESLTYYKMGSFPGVYPEAMLYLYSQSWAFVSFLMEKYPKEFMRYQARMADEEAKEHEDIDWLLEALGRDLKTLQKEFEEYMNTYDTVEDPYIARFMKLRSIFKD